MEKIEKYIDRLKQRCRINTGIFLNYLDIYVNILPSSQFMKEHLASPSTLIPGAVTKTILCMCHVTSGSQYQDSSMDHVCPVLYHREGAWRQFSISMPLL